MSEIIQKMSDMIKNSASSNNKNSSYNGSENDGASDASNGFNIDMDTMLKMKSIMDNMNKGQNDPRANLLRSLKPYLKSSRKEKVDQYIKLFSMGKAFEMMGPFTGEKKNGL